MAMAIDAKLAYIANHVFFPVQVPQQCDQSRTNDVALCTLVHQIAKKYQDLLPEDDQRGWQSVIRMLDNLSQIEQFAALPAEEIDRQLSEMRVNDVRLYYIRAQNAAVIVRKHAEEYVVESFEVAASREDVLKATGKLQCSYPGPAIAVAHVILDDVHFRKEFATFLSHMSVDQLDSAAKTIKAGSQMTETWDTAYPGYITELLTGILRGLGRPADVERLVKRINDDVLSQGMQPWRRSPLWLTIRVSLQTSLSRANCYSEYKQFMLYFMSRLLRLTVKRKFASALVYCFRAKVARRLLKLATSAPQFIAKEVREAIEQTQPLLSSRWETIQNDQATPPPWAPATLDIQSDTHLTLHNAGAYISARLAPRDTASAVCSFKPNHSRRLRDTHSCDFLAFDVNALQTAFAASGDVYVALADFEMLVQDCIDRWSSDSLLEEWACAKFARCITMYFAAAKDAYEGNPEDQSIMLLTIFELWVALDRTAVAQCPLLRDYSPEVPQTLFPSLLLRKSVAHERLLRLEEYLEDRIEHARSGSVFSDRTDPTSFSVRYYSTSPTLKELKQRIEDDAQRDRKEKCDEVERRNKDHRRLVDEAASLLHSGDNRWGCRKWGCRKCQLTRGADGMEVMVHEWPLPRGEHEAQAIVFELQCPGPFRIWRTTTYEILNDMCQERGSNGVSPPVTLNDYVGLQKYIQSGHISRISVASTAKSFSDTHYRSVHLPTTVDKVCVNNTLMYRLFDSERCQWAADIWDSSRSKVGQLCTLSLHSSGPYHGLQYAVSETTHMPNRVLASQSDCPVDLSLHEYTAFALLRSGGRLQWLNILRELRAEELSLDREETHLLIIQAICQVGPLVDGSREWHVEPATSDYAMLLLSELRNLLSSIEGNWSNATAAKTITMLSCRLLSSTHYRHVQKSAYDLLREIRRVTMGWMCQVSANLANSSDEVERFDLQIRICALAAICRSTYDVDHHDLRQMLASEEDIFMFVECAVHLHDNTPTAKQDIPPDLSRLLARDRRLSHYLESVLGDRIRALPNALDGPLSALWGEFQSGHCWQREQVPNDRWFFVTYCRTTVHLNILSGELLVCGRPLGRLPSAIVSHLDYIRIFSKKILDVIPSNIPGMDFATRGELFGLHVHFSLNPGDGQLIVKTRVGPDMYELVPHSKLIGDFPTPFVNNYVHWLKQDPSPDCCEIEFRPFEAPWTPSRHNWRIQFSTTSPSIMYKDRIRLLDYRSSTFSMIAGRLRSLERQEYQIVTCSTDENSLSVDLPRFELSFVLKDGELESNTWRNLIIDSKNQSAGTMFGLSEQLLLIRRASVQGLASERHVVIPVGTVNFRSTEHHVHVQIDTGSETRVQYQKYKIDENLGCLVGNGTLVSKLYQVYLHALTSHCLLDPLTDRTGTEEALSELRSARCLSFQKLGQQEVKLLSQISALTPQREYSPRHLRVMQTVCWSDLSAVSQHPGFAFSAEMILEHAAKLHRIFYRDEGTPKFQREDWHLQHRAAVRTNAIYGHEFSIRTASDSDDVQYCSRSSPSGTSSEQDIATVSAYVHNRPSSIHARLDVLQVMQSWSMPVSVPEEIEMSYNRDWLAPNLPKIWLSLYEYCRLDSAPNKQSRLQFALSAMTYKFKDLRQAVALVGTILAFATVPKFQDDRLRPPCPLSTTSYCLADGFEPELDRLTQMAMSCTIPYDPWTSASNFSRRTSETLDEYDGRRRSHHVQLCESRAHELVEYLMRQWPCHTPHVPTSFEDAVMLEDFREQAQQMFHSWYNNRELRNHLRRVQEVLDQLPQITQAPAPDYILPVAACTRHTSASIDMAHLFEQKPPKLEVCNPALELQDILRSCQSTINYARQDGTDPLEELVREFQYHPSSPLRQHYGRSLEDSRAIHAGIQASSATLPTSCPIELLLCHQDHCRKAFFRTVESIRSHLRPCCDAELAVFTAGQWPRLTIRSLLHNLASTSRMHGKIPGEWVSCLVSCAQVFLHYQRSQRLVEHASRQHFEDLVRELESVINDDVLHPDWLLVQIENNFLMRPLQQDVAQKMIAPSLPEKKNGVLQLNMGEGKSAVIAPVVATALADGQTLVRVVTLKPLASQMFHLLVDRLSGLANRRIFYLPFSRQVQVGSQVVDQIRALLEECVREKGILLVQPEHILSFKLMGIDYSGSNDSVAQALLTSQRWLDVVSRDLLDESDEMLNVRYQLVYTAGQQRPVEDHPDRWRTVQQVLSLVEKHVFHVLTIRGEHADNIEFTPGVSGTYGRIRILRQSVWDELSLEIGRDIIRSDPALRYLPEALRSAVPRFITSNSTGSSGQEVRFLEEHCRGDSLWKKLLLLRGLLGHGLIGYIFKEKRWRVDYGLDPTRTLLAVPYRAKDVPSLRADFGHPDVAIALTCLSYYYGGLTDDQLDTCFELLMKSDEREALYETWVHGNSNVPAFLQELRGVNIDDSHQREHLLFPLFRSCRSVIDFYLSEVVFPKEAKQFPEKLSTSAWDLAETKEKVTTGFSGTKDNQYLLPSSITQYDPVGQEGTNARVLSFLLQPENRLYIRVAEQSHRPAASRKYLELIVAQDSEVRVLLDVGAQMLDMENLELVKCWLSLKPNVPAAIFFDQRDELMVLTQSGTVEAFGVSPYSQQLDMCVVYLDDAHTRGTDLKLPRNTRAAVTLGPKVTKDRLLQGCMRMRKLGQGHSVLFLAPPEVDAAIRELAGHKSTVETVDILRWAMVQTCTYLEHHISHWAHQGVDYRKRSEAWNESRDLSDDDSLTSADAGAAALRTAWLSPEARSLEEMYGLSARNGDNLSVGQAIFDDPDLRDRFDLFGISSSSLRDPSMDEEQEREVSQEVEQEREVERPPPARPAQHHLHRDVVDFIRTGKLPMPLGAAFMPLFSPLEGISGYPGNGVWSSRLLATRDFATTIDKDNSSHHPSDYMGPVNWILSSRVQDHLIVFSAFEVNKLLPEIRQSKVVRLHMYSPRVTHSMEPLDDLKYHCIPPLSRRWEPNAMDICQLNLWAGQLYFTNHNRYLDLCMFLGICAENRPKGARIQADGFVETQDRDKLVRILCSLGKDPLPCPFDESQLPLLKELVGLRRKGMGYELTHMGKVLHSGFLTEKDFEDYRV